MNRSVGAKATSVNLTVGAGEEVEATGTSLLPSFRDLAIVVYREAETNSDPEWAHAMP